RRMISRDSSTRIRFRPFTPLRGVPSNRAFFVFSCFRVFVVSCVSWRPARYLRETTNAGTCPPPDVTFARPVELSRVRNPEMRQQIERLPVARDAALLDQDGPRDVTADHVALGGAEQVRVALVGEDREEGFLVRNLAPQRVGDAHRTLFVRGDERTALLLPR